jgi:hypothetical protein
MRSGSVLAKKLISLGGVKFDYNDFLTKPMDAGGSRNSLIASKFEQDSCRLNEMAMLDLLILQRGDFFIGNPSSTFSQYVCLLRGVKRARDSNMCVWQLIKYGLLPPDYKVRMLYASQLLLV